MRWISRPLFLVIALILVLLSAACGAEQGAPATLAVTLLPGRNSLTSTPVAPTATIGAIATATGLGANIPAGTATPSRVETATVITGNINTQVVGTRSSPVRTTPTSGIPVTGQDIMLVECQFCVDTQAHALLVLPGSAAYKIVSPAVSASATSTASLATACTTVEVNNGKQVVLCRGPEMTPLVLNICTDANTCTDFPVDLLACPLTQGGNGAIVTPGQTQGTPTDIAGALVSPTLNPGVTITTASPAR